MAIRGVSDIVGYRRSHDWLNYACQTAASFSISLIKAGLLANAEGWRPVAVVESGEGIPVPPGNPLEKGPILVLRLARLAHDVFVPGPCPDGNRIGTVPPAGAGPAAP